MRSSTWCWIIVFAMPVEATTLAGTVNLWGIADGDSTYIEEPSEGFYRMDFYDPPPRETQQRFHNIVNPSITYGSLEYDGFPNDENFRLGYVVYDESGVVGGNGTAPVTAIALGIGQDPSDPTYYNYYRWTDLATDVNSFSGTVTMTNGSVTSIDLMADVTLGFKPFGTFAIEVPGTFQITGNRFEGYMELVVDEGPPELSIIYDFAGTLTTVGITQPGDFDHDGDVDGRDFLLWQRNPGIGELADWQANYGVGTVADLDQAIPEPTAGSLAIVAMLIYFANASTRQTQSKAAWPTRPVQEP